MHTRSKPQLLLHLITRFFFLLISAGTSKFGSIKHLSHNRDRLASKAIPNTSSPCCQLKIYHQICWVKPLTCIVGTRHGFIVVGIDGGILGFLSGTQRDGLEHSHLKSGSTGFFSKSPPKSWLMLNNFLVWRMKLNFTSYLILGFWESP